MKNDYDFGGWATRNNIQCSDGRTIMKDAFKQNDGQKVPLVWNHQHNDPSEVLGHALLENREDGVYAYCKFNNTESGQTAKSLVMNGDVDKLSIYANKLKSQMNNVIHGCIREVSLVLAGANPGAYIDSVIVHGEGAEAEEEVIIYNDGEISLSEDETDISEETPEDGEIEHSDDANKEKEDSTKMGEDEKKEKTVREKLSQQKGEQAPIKDKEVYITKKGETLFFEPLSGRYFKSDIDHIKNVVNELNRRMVTGENYVSLSDFYTEIGLAKTEISDDLGWRVDNAMIEIDYNATKADDETPCLSLDFLAKPTCDYYNFY